MTDSNDRSDSSRWFQEPRQNWGAIGVSCLVAAYAVHATTSDTIGTGLALINLGFGLVCLTAAAIDGPHILPPERVREPTCGGRRSDGVLQRIKG
ncbi:MAG: hypothetical protein ABEL04_06995, partial [Salinibacter sp.]